RSQASTNKAHSAGLRRIVDLDLDMSRTWHDAQARAFMPPVGGLPSSCVPLGSTPSDAGRGSARSRTRVWSRLTCPVQLVQASLGILLIHSSFSLALSRSGEL